ncbi:MAG: PEP-CTERM sorting domain-containing protein [Pseudomonadota bacterium]
MSKLLLAVVSFLVAAASQATTVNFDEFTSPPVSCCFGNPTGGVPVVYPTVAITGGPSGAIMNGTGWDNQQTSGDNLYGTLDGTITFNFNQPTSNFSLDVINGDFSESSFSFTVTEFDGIGNVIDSMTLLLGQFTTPAAVGHFALSGIGVFSATVVGNSDFAVDTISFDASNQVPEPATLVLIAIGLLATGARRRLLKVRAG